MIKTSIMFSAHTAHVLHVVMRDTLIILVVLFVALFAWLKYGIQAESLTLGQYKIEGLYIKLDKKLTFKADKIVIPRTKENPSFSKIDDIVDRVKYLLTFFDSIALREVDFENNSFKFLFMDDVLYLVNDVYEVAGNIERKGNVLVADISLLYIKKEKINLSGKVKYFLNKERLEVEGAFNAYQIKGNFAAYKEDDVISFAIKSDPFSDLKTLTSRLPVENDLKQWIAYKIESKSYVLHSLIGKITMKDDEPKLDLKGLMAEATLKDVKIRFHKKLAPVLVNEIKLSYRNYTLYFDLKNPTYKKRKLAGSSVSIRPLMEKSIPYLNLNLHVKSKIDKVVHNILNVYDIHLPVTQSTKDVIADINMSIPLQQKFSSTKEASKHKTHTWVNLKLPNAAVYINKRFILPVKGGSVRYKDGKVILKLIRLKDKNYTILMNGLIDLKKKKVLLRTLVERISLGENKKKIFFIKNKEMDISVNYGKEKVEIPSVSVTMHKEKDTFVINLLDLKKIKPYLRNMDIEMDGGSLEVKTDDFASYVFSGVLKRNACFFYDKDNVCHTRVPCQGEVSKNKFVFTAFNKRLHINVPKSIIEVRDLNIDLKAFFDFRESLQANESTSGSKSLSIFGRKSKLRYEAYTLVTDKYDIEVKPNGDVVAVGVLGKDKVKMVKKGKNIKIEALRIQDRLLHPLINFNGLYNGRYTFKTYGSPDKEMHGEVIIEGGVMRDFKAYNNTLAFINSIPALATLHDPGFSKKGFVIKKGVAKYRKIKDKIYFDNIHIEGTSASIVGKGMIDLKKKTIYMNLAIQTAREFGKVLSAVPVLGYILMGEDKSMTVGLKISGSLSKPKVETSATTELLRLPLDLIRRTLQAPVHLVEKKPKKKPAQREKPKRKKLLNRVAP